MCPGILGGSAPAGRVDSCRDMLPFDVRHPCGSTVSGTGICSDGLGALLSEELGRMDGAYARELGRESNPVYAGDRVATGGRAGGGGICWPLKCPPFVASTGVWGSLRLVESALERLGGGGGGMSSEYVCCCGYGIAGKGGGGSTGGDWPGMRGKGRGPRCVGDCTLPVLDGGRAVGRGEEGSP